MYVGTYCWCSCSFAVILCELVSGNPPYIDTRFSPAEVYIQLLLTSNNSPGLLPTWKLHVDICVIDQAHRPSNKPKEVSFGSSGPMACSPVPRSGSNPLESPPTIRRQGPAVRTVEDSTDHPDPGLCPLEFLWAPHKFSIRRTS